MKDFLNSAMLTVAQGAPARRCALILTICRRYLAQAVTCGWLNTIERA